MKKLTKRERETVISYNQTNDPAEIYTHDLKLKRRLFALCEEYPDVCELIDVDEHGGHCFLADKERISIHVTRPYSEERRRKQSDWAKKNGMKGNQSADRARIASKKDNVS